MIDEYGNGRMAVVAEVCEWIERERIIIEQKRAKVRDKKDLLSTHKRASLAGASRTLGHIADLMKKKKSRRKNYESKGFPVRKFQYRKYE